MLEKLINYLDLAIAYLRLNFNAQLEYRGAFITQVAAMFINDSFWVLFWVLFFNRFHVLRGWGVNDVITIWAITAAGFGLAHGIFGNALFLPSLIARGQLDVWMLYPRSMLSHLILGKMHATAWGDALFGFVVYLAFVKPDLAHLAMFTLLTLGATVLFVGFSILSGSLGFYLGNSESVSEHWRFALITFATYPATLFEGWVKLILFTLIPAGFINYLPIEALHRLSLGYAGLALLGSLSVLASGVFVFYHGLRRYESGNLMEMRG